MGTPGSKDLSTQGDRRKGGDENGTEGKLQLLSHAATDVREPWKGLVRTGPVGGSFMSGYCEKRLRHEIVGNCSRTGGKLSGAKEDENDKRSIENKENSGRRNKLEEGRTKITSGDLLKLTSWPKTQDVHRTKIETKVAAKGKGVLRGGTLGRQR